MVAIGPEAPDASDESQSLLNVLALVQPGKRQAEIIQRTFKRIEPRRLGWTGQLGDGLLHQGETPIAVSCTKGVVLTTVVQLLEGVLVDALEHPESGLQLVDVRPM